MYQAVDFGELIALKVARIVRMVQFAAFSPDNVNAIRVILASSAKPHAVLAFGVRTAPMNVTVKMVRNVIDLMVLVSVRQVSKEVFVKKFVKIGLTVIHVIMNVIATKRILFNASMITACAYVRTSGLARNAKNGRAQKENMEHCVNKIAHASTMGYAIQGLEVVIVSMDSKATFATKVRKLLGNKAR